LAMTAGVLLTFFIAVFILHHGLCCDDACVTSGNVGMSLLQRSSTADTSAKLAAHAGKHFAQEAPHALSEQGYWPQKNGGPIKTGSSQFVAPFNLSAGPSWSFTEPDYGVVRATPVIDGNRNIYLSTTLGRVYKFSRTGKMLWKYDIGNADQHLGEVFTAVPALYDGMLFNLAMMPNATVFALDMETGKVRWSKVYGACLDSDTTSISAAEGVLVVANNLHGECWKGSSLVSALNASNGDVLWSFRPDAHTYNLMAVITNGTVVFEDFQGNLYRLRLADGELLWKTAVPSNWTFTSGGAILAPNGVIYGVGNVGNFGENASVRPTS